MPAKHSWEDAIDVSRLAPPQRGQVIQTLNWLEQYFPEFNEMIYEIQQGQQQGKLKKIKILRDQFTEYDTGDDSLYLNFKPAYYLGNDSKIYVSSLNEDLVHELEHAVQKTDPNFQKKENHRREFYKRVAPHHQALSNYLESKGISKEYMLIAYVPWIRNSGNAKEKSQLDSHILQDPVYQKLALAWFSAYKAKEDSAFPAENEAMDRTNILSQLLGKPPRGHYLDTDVLYEQIEAIGGKMVIYTDSPEIIRRRGHPSWSTPNDLLLPPIIHGKPGILKGHIADMQREWNNKWNADTKNITSDEWRVIEEVKGALFKEKAPGAMSAKEKKQVDGIIAELKGVFNQSAGNDAINAALDKKLEAHGLGALSNKITPKGWQL